MDARDAAYLKAVTFMVFIPILLLIGLVSAFILMEEMALNSCIDQGMQWYNGNCLETDSSLTSQGKP